ncbi:Diaminopimelate decarboxylase [hydrothermal vent metagenome]|uniref:diaminopimelate decarboxylase n=1 Tax=hydrothermal vent metagenome TaxID=652676 RepID=A0A3B0ZMJ4_9ZZZZ
MDYFNYRDNELYAEDVTVDKIIQTYGSPCYIYSRATFERHWNAFNDALSNHEHLVCYAVKANSNIAILNILAKLGSGFDIVSVGELERVLAAGGDPEKIVFSGVGKTAKEMHRALAVGIYCFNIESESELYRLNLVASQLGKVANISIRVNPDVDAGTHPYISTGLKDNKFGIEINAARAVYKAAVELKHINIVGIDCHIGSQLTDTEPFLDALDRVLVLVDTLAKDGIDIHHLDLGGGLGIRYKDEQPPLPDEYARALSERLASRKLKILIEPGRAIAGNAGILVTTVEYLKKSEHKNFAIVDAAMNDLIRPSLYSAWQDIIPVKINTDIVPEQYDVVGPVCETGDFLGKQRDLAITEGDMLAVCSSGAYGFTMSSNYNSRPRTVEIMVDGDAIHVIRERESITALFALESMMP